MRTEADRELEAMADLRVVARRQSLYGIGVTENRRLVLGRFEIASEREQVAADLGPLPAALDLADFQGDFPYRGLACGRMERDRPIGWPDRLLRRR